MNSAANIGDTVKGDYYGVAFEGVVTSHSGGWIYVTLSAPIEVCGSMRGRVGLDGHQRKALTIVSKADLSALPVETHRDGAYLAA
jgi:hypothetical protein